MKVIYDHDYDDDWWHSSQNWWPTTLWDCIFFYKLIDEIMMMMNLYLATRLKMADTMSLLFYQTIFDYLHRYIIVIDWLILCFNKNKKKFLSIDIFIYSIQTFLLIHSACFYKHLICSSSSPSHIRPHNLRNQWKNKKKERKIQFKKIKFFLFFHTLSINPIKRTTTKKNFRTTTLLRKLTIIRQNKTNNHHPIYIDKR